MRRITDKSSLVVCSIAIMFIGLLFSRAVLSFGTAFFFVFAIAGIQSKDGGWKKFLLDFINNKYAVLLSFLFIIPFVSGLWSNDLQEWWRSCVVKLPLLIMPVAFVATPVLKSSDYKLLSWLFIILITAGTAWSFGVYETNPVQVNEAYLKAAIMSVPFDNDHVRFSWAVVIAMLLLVKLLKDFIVDKGEKLFAIIIIAWLGIYLHILAAKTGLIAFYLCLIIFYFSLFKNKKNKGWLIASCLLPPALLLIAYCLLPTFHNRMDFIAWDFKQYSAGHFPPGLPDGARVLSWKGGYEIFRHHFFTGIGFGDIGKTMQEWYNSAYSYLPKHDRILPSNQFLIYGCGAGIAGLLVFSITVLFPFFMKQERKKFYWICFHAVAVFCFLTDIGLEVQYGVFLYCFFAGWFKMETTNTGPRTADLK